MLLGPLVPDGAYSVHTVDNHMIPFRGHGSELQFLWPGDHTSSTLKGPDRLHISVSPGQSANE